MKLTDRSITHGPTSAGIVRLVELVAHGRPSRLDPDRLEGRGPDLGHAAGIDTDGPSRSTAGSPAQSYTATSSAPLGRTASNATSAAPRAPQRDHLPVERLDAGVDAEQEPVQPAGHGVAEPAVDVDARSRPEPRDRR